MPRHLIAYLLIAALVVVMAFFIVRIRYYSRENMLKRRRLAEEAHWAALARLHGEEEPRG